MREIKIRTIDSIDAIQPEQWDLCAGNESPFCLHAFLRTMERSGSATGRSGWQALHLLAESADGTVVGCAPNYVKSHSFGEYVFDWGWSEAWQRSGRAYYPKLQCAIPFTPATGPRLMVHPDWRGQGVERALAKALVRILDQAEMSGAHITFLTVDEADQLTDAGWLLRTGVQYHWTNDGYRSFDDFLAALSSRKRKAIRKERERAHELGVTIHTLTGADIGPEHWAAFYGFYIDTIEKKWAHAYLTPEFFTLLGEAMPERVVLFMAEQNGQWVAGALNFLGRDTLYGRNWGAAGDFRYLHFEMCYYRAIDYAIAHGLTRVEAGAQGEHKISRGYLPSPTYSVHWIRELHFRMAIADFLERERDMMAVSMLDLMAESPFRRGE
jgi:predicted N-acyltransferase